MVFITGEICDGYHVLRRKGAADDQPWTQAPIPSFKYTQSGRPAYEGHLYTVPDASEPGGMGCEFHREERTTTKEVKNLIGNVSNEMIVIPEITEKCDAVYRPMKNHTWKPTGNMVHPIAKRDGYYRLNWQLNETTADGDPIEPGWCGVTARNDCVYRNKGERIPGGNEWGRVPEMGCYASDSYEVCVDPAGIDPLTNGCKTSEFRRIYLDNAVRVFRNIDSPPLPDDPEFRGGTWGQATPMLYVDVNVNGNASQIIEEWNKITGTVGEFVQTYIPSYPYNAQDVINVERVTDATFDDDGMQGPDHMMACMKAGGEIGMRVKQPKTPAPPREPFPWEYHLPGSPEYKAALLQQGQWTLTCGEGHPDTPSPEQMNEAKNAVRDLEDSIRSRDEAGETIPETTRAELLDAEDELQRLKEAQGYWANENYPGGYTKCVIDRSNREVEARERKARDEAMAERQRILDDTVNRRRVFEMKSRFSLTTNGLCGENETGYKTEKGTRCPASQCCGPKSGNIWSDAGTRTCGGQQGEPSTFCGTPARGGLSIEDYDGIGVQMDNADKQEQLEDVRYCLEGDNCLRAWYTQNPNRSWDTYNPDDDDPDIWQNSPDNEDKKCRSIRYPDDRNFTASEISEFPGKTNQGVCSYNVNNTDLINDNVLYRVLQDMEMSDPRQISTNPKNNILVPNLTGWTETREFEYDSNTIDGNHFKTCENQMKSTSAGYSVFKKDDEMIDPTASTYRWGCIVYDSNNNNTDLDRKCVDSPWEHANTCMKTPTGKPNGSSSNGFFWKRLVPGRTLTNVDNDSSDLLAEFYARIVLPEDVPEWNDCKVDRAKVWKWPIDNYYTTLAKVGGAGCYNMNRVSLGYDIDTFKEKCAEWKCDEPPPPPPPPPPPAEYHYTHDYPDDDTWAGRGKCFVWSSGTGSERNADDFPVCTWKSGGWVTKSSCDNSKCPADQIKDTGGPGNTAPYKFSSKTNMDLIEEMRPMCNTYKKFSPSTYDPRCCSKLGICH